MSGLILKLHKRRSELRKSVFYCPLEVKHRQNVDLMKRNITAQSVSSNFVAFFKYEQGKSISLD